MDDLFEYAKTLQHEGQLSEAADCYRQVLAADPGAYRALNNLGVVLEALGNLTEAIAAYRRALEIQPALPALHYNLGHALQAQDCLEEAAGYYRQVLALQPDHVAALYNLGNALWELRRLLEAEAAYRQLLNRQPPPDDDEFFKVPSNLGMMLCEQNRFDEAETFIRQALSLNPESAPDYASLGRVLSAQRQFDAAKEAYRRALELRPTLLAAREGLAEIHYLQQEPEQAAAVYAEMLKLYPDDPIARHIIAAYGGADAPLRASDAYVETLFDLFADSFDRNLASLQYHAPALLGSVVARVCQPQGQLDVLDAGCGTGLCQSHLRPYARRLVGVDLSEKMLEKARRRGGYDELLKGELTAFLVSCTQAYDLIVSADTLVYFGDLTAVIEAAAGALRAGGWLAFTLEQLEEQDTAGGFKLNPHGRYSHTRSYVWEVLERAGFTHCSLTAEVLRLERGKPVPGWVVLADRS